MGRVRAGRRDRAARRARSSCASGPLATAVRDPMAMAMGVASVAALARRPVHLAIGSSSQMVVERWHGRTRERTARHIRETAEALRPLLAGEKGELRGRAGAHATATGCGCRLPATSLTIAAFGDATVRVAARLADRMVLNLVTPELVGTDGRPRTPAGGVGRRPPWIPTPEAHAQLARGLIPYLASGGIRRDVHRRRVRRAGRCGARRRPPGAAAGAACPPELGRGGGTGGYGGGGRAGAPASTSTPAWTSSCWSPRPPATTPARASRSCERLSQGFAR